MKDISESIMMVVAFVAAVRRYVPKVDGWLVLILSACASAAVVALEMPASTPRELAQRVAYVFVGAVGGTRFAQYLVDRHAEASKPEAAAQIFNIKQDFRDGDPAKMQKVVEEFKEEAERRRGG